MSIMAAIDRLIENQGSSSSSSSSMEKNSAGKSEQGKNAVEKRPVYSYNSNAAVNTQTGSLSPSSSPYIIAFKGRSRWQNGSTSDTTTTDSSSSAAADARNPPFIVASSSKFRDPGPSEQQQASEFSRSVSSRKQLDPLKGGLSLSFKRELKNGYENEDAVGKFLNDKQEIIAADIKSEQKRPVRMTSPGLPRHSFASSGIGEEFFDAFEHPFSDTSSQSGDIAEIETGPEVTTEAPAQKQQQPQQATSHKAEEVLELVLQKLAAGGLDVPPTLDQVEDLDIAGQLYIKRFVEAAVARGAARAEMEEQLLNELEIKNSEIENKSREVTRLRDKVRYNERLNREMFQINQEAVELARNRKRIKRIAIRCAFGAACVAVGIGVSVALSRKYAPLQTLKAWRQAAPSADNATMAIQEPETGSSEQ